MLDINRNLICKNLPRKGSKYPRFISYNILIWCKNHCFHSIILIFKFFWNLVNKRSCIFMHANSWNSIDQFELHVIRFTQARLSMWYKCPCTSIFKFFKKVHAWPCTSSTCLCIFRAYILNFCECMLIPITLCKKIWAFICIFSWTLSLALWFLFATTSIFFFKILIIFHKILHLRELIFTKITYKQLHSCNFVLFMSFQAQSISSK